ncbi:MAG: hypothetical protein QXE31_02675 [Candidatus Woesearchaeota archaeon]
MTLETKAEEFYIFQVNTNAVFDLYSLAIYLAQFLPNFYLEQKRENFLNTFRIYFTDTKNRENSEKHLGLILRYNAKISVLELFLSDKTPNYKDIIKSLQQLYQGTDFFENGSIVIPKITPPIFFKIF